MKTSLLTIHCSLLILCTLVLHSCHMGDSKVFHDGRTLVTEGRYQEAIPILKSYLQQYPNGKHASRAGLFLGKSYLALGDYINARETWQLVIDQYPYSLEAHKCKYKNAVTDYIQGQTESARQQFEDLAKDPSGPLAPEALAFQRFIENQTITMEKTVVE